MRRNTGSGKPSPMEELNRLQQDIGLLLQRIADMTNETTAANSVPLAGVSATLRGSASATSVSSPFVSGLRGLAEQERNASKVALSTSSNAASGGGDTSLEKLALIEMILAKVTEFDRIILFKTNPVKDEGLFPVRRKSMKGELHSLPSHFQLADRLMDLYNQSQRVLVVRDQSKMSGSGSQGMNAPSSSSQSSARQGVRSEGTDAAAALRKSEQEISELRLRLETVTKSLAAAEGKCRDSEGAEKLAAKKLLESEEAVSRLEKRLMESDETASTLKALLKAAEESAHIHSPQKLQQHSTPAVNSPLNARVRNLEEQLESERGIHEGIVAALLETASGILNGTGVAEPSNGVHLPDDVRKALSFLLDAFRRSGSNLSHEKDELQTAKIALEKQLAFMSKERDNANENLQALAATHESLRLAYSEAGAQLLKMQEQKRTSAYKELEFERATKMLAELQQEVSDLRASSESTKTLETRLHFLEEEKRQLQSANSFMKEDLKSANDMIEKLKETLRTMSGKDEAFFDTFEGVMREEMMAMKAAFEAKLRAAKEETNALSRKHFEDIKKMKTDLTTPLGRARMGVSSQGLGMSATSTATTTSFASMNTTGTGIGVGAGAGASTTSGGYGPGRSAI